MHPPAPSCGVYRLRFGTIGGCCGNSMTESFWSSTQIAAQLVDARQRGHELFSDGHCRCRAGVVTGFERLVLDHGMI